MEEAALERAVEWTEALQAQRHPELSIEQSILLNLNNGVDIFSVADAHNVSFEKVQALWMQHCGELSALKYCRWSQIADLMAAGAAEKCRQVFSNPERFNRLNLGQLLRYAQIASDVAEKNARLALEIQNLPVLTNAAEFTTLQRDVFLQLKEMLSEPEIIDRALMGNKKIQRICEENNVDWRAYYQEEGGNGDHEQ